MDNPAVSIIMACYNSEKWIKETIQCVKDQTFCDWELLITDDCSSDSSVAIIKEEEKKDSRIKLYVFEDNQGAGKARNNSMLKAKGRYIAYLDSDDLWRETKLEHQIAYMQDKGLAMCYTDYDIVNENGKYRKTIKVPKSITYQEYLRHPITCTHSIMFDTEKIDKRLLLMPDIRRGQDGATWLQVLKTGVKGYALSEPLAKYRRHEGSLSSNKIKAVKRMWYLYRKVEHLSLGYSCLCFVSYTMNAIRKYI